MSTTARDLYRLYGAALTAIDDFAHAEGIVRSLPSPVAPALEFPRHRSIVAPVIDAPQLFLPASNTYQKQVAAAHQGSVYCVAPCYRQDENVPIGSDVLYLNIFHQIEFEIPGASMEEARTMAARLLSRMWAQVDEAGFDPPPWSFTACETVDLATLPDAPPTLADYDRWALQLAEELDAPAWIIHTPRTPPPRLNLDYGHGGSTELTLGFDLVTPAGELLSGGERDTEQTRSFYGEQPWLNGLQLGSSGFGIGLERTLRAITGAPTVRSVVLPHCIDGRV